MTKSQLTLATILASLLFNQSLHAQTLVFTTAGGTQPVTSNSEIWTYGSFGNHWIQPLSGTTMDMRLELNGDDQTVTFRRTTIDIDEVINLSGDFGSSGTVTISGMIEFDATLNFLDDQALSSTVQPGNRFEINNFDRELGHSDQTLLTGSYSFSGPTESASGTFSVNPYWSRVDTPIIDATDFPNSVTLEGNPYWWTSIDENIFTETIDGASISVELRQAVFYSPDNFIIPAPEPSTYAFVGGICLVAFATFRRMKFAKTRQLC